MSLSENTQFRARDQRKPNHHWADNEVLDECAARIGAYGYAVYMYICRWAGNDDGRCVKSQREIASAFGISTDTVGRAVQKLIAARLLAKHDEPGRPSEFIVLEVRKRSPKPAAHSGTHMPPAAEHLPPTAERPPLTAAHLPPTAVRNKEARLSQDFSPDVGAGRPAHGAAWTIAQKQFWDEFERQAPRPGHFIANPDQEIFQRLRAAANRVGLSAAQAKTILLEHPAWKDWPYTALLDSRQEIAFPQPERTDVEKTYPAKPRPTSAQSLVADAWVTETSPEREAQAQALWRHVDEFVKARISANSYSTWVKPLHGVALTGGTLIVRVPTPEFKHVGQKFRELIRQAMADARNPDTLNAGPQDGGSAGGGSTKPGSVTEVKFLTPEEMAGPPRARSA